MNPGLSRNLRALGLPLVGYYGSLLLSIPPCPILQIFPISAEHLQWHPPVSSLVTPTDLLLASLPPFFVLSYSRTPADTFLEPTVHSGQTSRQANCRFHLFLCSAKSKSPVSPTALQQDNWCRLLSPSSLPPKWLPHNKDLERRPVDSKIADMPVQTTRPSKTFNNNRWGK